MHYAFHVDESIRLRLWRQKSFRKHYSSLNLSLPYSDVVVVIAIDSCCKGSFPLVKQWWNSDETGWISMKQDDSERWNSDETCWIRMNQQWNNLFHGRETTWNMLNQDESAMKQFVSWSWNTVKHVESRWNMAMKHLESGWNSVSWSWNILNQDETVCFMPMKHLESGTVTTEISIFLYWFLVLGVSLLFLCCFIPVSCCFIAVSLLFHAVSLLFNAVSLLFHAVSLLFHGVSLLCFMVFQGVSLPCSILFHDHETRAVGTSLYAVMGDLWSLEIPFRFHCRQMFHAVFLSWVSCDGWKFPYVFNDYAARVLQPNL